MKSKSLIRSVMVVLASAAAASLLASCNTVHGLGSDVKTAGRGIERTADRAR